MPSFVGRGTSKIGFTSFRRRGPPIFAPRSCGARQLKPLGRAAGKWSGVLMATVTAPAACAGVVAVMVVVLMRRTFVAAVPPKVMVTPTWNPLPAIVTFVPPAAAPAPGETVV